MKLLQEETGNTLVHIGTGNNFINGILIAQQLNERIDKWESMKLKSFCKTKETVTRLKRQAMEWERIFASYTSGKGFITRIYRKLNILAII
jgi:hypothetical protein